MLTGKGAAVDVEKATSGSASPRNTECMNPVVPAPYEETQELVNLPSTLPALVRGLRPPHGDPSSKGQPLYYCPEVERDRFVRDELTVRGLDRIVNYLWLAGIPGNVRPLTRHRCLGRSIIANEQISLHLTWRDDKIFIKPMPQWMLHHDSFLTFVWNNPGATTPPNPTADANKHKATAYRRSAALGFLLSYTKLICYESDLLLAQEAALLPAEITYPQWTAFASAIISAVTAPPSTAAGIYAIAPRYAYGELRLSRINLIYRFAPRFFPAHLLTGYYSDPDRTSSFIARNFYWVLSVFLWITVVLQGLQLGVATQQGMERRKYQEAAWVLSWLGLAAPAFACVLVLVVVGTVIVVNFCGAWLRRVRGGGEGDSVGWDANIGGPSKGTP